MPKDKALEDDEPATSEVGADQTESLRHNN